jgi:hypothetical protein
MAEPFKLSIDSSSEPAPCERCGNNETRNQCVTCKVPHYICDDCYPYHAENMRMLLT